MSYLSSVNQNSTLGTFIVNWSNRNRKLGLAVASEGNIRILDNATVSSKEYTQNKKTWAGQAESESLEFATALISATHNVEET